MQRSLKQTELDIDKVRDREYRNFWRFCDLTGAVELQRLYREKVNAVGVPTSHSELCEALADIVVRRRLREIRLDA